MIATVCGVAAWVGRLYALWSALGPYGAWLPVALASGTMLPEAVSFANLAKVGCTGVVDIKDRQVISPTFDAGEHTGTNDRAAA